MQSRLLADGILCVFGVVFLLPFVWLVLAALNPGATGGFSRFEFSFGNFATAVHDGAGRAIFNSLYLSVVSTLVATIAALFAAYVLSRKRVPFKGALLVGVLFLSALPSTLLLVPIYEEFVKFNWLNSPFYTSLALASASLPFSIWIVKNFIDQIPREYEEAAAVEGSGDFRILSRIIFPLTLPGVIVAAMLTFVSSWGAFLVPLVLDGNPGDVPASVGIYNFLSANAGVQYGPLAAYAILFSIPVVGAYVVSVRWLNGGFAFAGGVKG
jgi:multiple sugar transport system permease protein